MKKREFKLYDTMSKTTKALATVEPDHLRFYACGPTVYSYAHIGNFRSFLTSDLIVRTAKAIGWRVTFVNNITDVGHLTDDDFADAQGEDKLEKALKSKEGEDFNNVWELAERYTEAFELDWKRLNMVEPDVRPKATQHVRQQILATQALIDRGHAYETPTGVYYSVESFPEYGKLSGNTQENLRQAVRDVVQDDNKRAPADFALWKKDDRHLMQWFSPWGWGFPGWHIECSAMAREYLGDTVDLHSGGEDNMFPHHECEIAQSEALTGKPFCKHWVHTRFLQVNGEKMSKSTGNWYTVRDLVQDKGADPLALRYALISVPYGKPLNFTLQSLKDATLAIERFKECDKIASQAAEKGSGGADTVSTALDQLYEETLDAMCDDLNTSVALAKAYEGTKVILRERDNLSKASGKSALEFLNKINALLGIVRHETEIAEDIDLGPKLALDEATILAKIQERADAKKNKDFAKADAIRNELVEQGIELIDTPDGTTWKAKSGI
ncbi:MAG: cysteine--tRNA ligase [Fimbriimonadaceae bacterium]|nr:cysteine--tRNA ligase [Fimbriimonadaceae bacterium]